MAAGHRACAARSVLDGREHGGILIADGRRCPRYRHLKTSENLTQKRRHIRHINPPDAINPAKHAPFKRAFSPLLTVLDDKLADIAQIHAIAEPLVREACVLHRLPSTSSAYWQGWNRLRARIGGKFHTLFAAVSRAMADTPRSSSLVENLNSRLRTYFTLRRHLGGSYLDLLRFFLNHRRFLRSRCAERQGKSPRELTTGQGHPHWLILLGLGSLQPQRA